MVCVCVCVWPEDNKRATWKLFHKNLASIQVTIRRHTHTVGERVANVRRKSTCCVLHWVFFYLCFPFFVVGWYHLWVYVGDFLQAISTALLSRFRQLQLRLTRSSSLLTQFVRRVCSCVNVPPELSHSLVQRMCNWSGISMKRSNIYTSNSKKRIRSLPNFSWPAQKSLQTGENPPTLSDSLLQLLQHQTQKRDDIVRLVILSCEVKLPTTQKKE